MNDFKKLARDLKKVGQIKTGEIRDKVLLIEADLLADQIKYNAPANFIRRDISVISRGAKYPLSVLVGLNYKSGSMASNLAYAFEYGTIERYTKKGAYRGILAPKPFFRPVVDSNRSQIVTNIVKRLSKIVENKLK